MVLIALRLFFPVKEFQVYSAGGSKIKIDELQALWNNLDKTIVVSSTIFHCIGIAIITGGIILIYELIRKTDK